METLYLYFSFIFLALSFLADYFLHKFHNLPPRPWLPSLPIIGHLYLLKRPLHKSLAKYGPIQLLQLGSRRVLVINSPSAAKECLIKNDIVFSNRPQILAGKYLAYNHSTIIFEPYGDHWRNLRRIFMHEILASHRIHEFEPIRDDEVHRMLRKLYHSSSGQAIEVQVRPVLLDLILNMLMRVVSGRRYYYRKDDLLGEEEQARQFQEIVAQVFQALGFSHIEDYVPIMRWFGVGKLEEELTSLKEKRDLLMQDLEEEIRRSVKNGDEGNTKRSLIQLLLSLEETEPESYTNEMIRGIVMVILAAGTDTSISTIEWAMSLLLNNPLVLEKAQTEINNWVGQDRCVKESDLTNLPYLCCIIKETMRMYPAGPLLPRESSENCMVGGYHVPRGTMLLVNTWGIQHDPNIWGDPETFRPDRFEGLEGHTNWLNVVQFGFGRRRCPAEVMAMRMVGLGLGSLIQCFEWEKTSKSQVDMSEGDGLSFPKAIQLVAMCRPRSISLNMLSQL